MSSSINETLIGYVRQDAQCKSRLLEITTQLNQAAKKNVDLMQKSSGSMQEISKKLAENPDYAESGKYQDDMQKAMREFNTKMAQVQDWELKLQQEKNNLMLRIDEIKEYENSFTPIAKQCITDEFKYAQDK